jgi:hypothetical protein
MTMYRHGQYGTRIYYMWQDMKKRCMKPYCNSYNDYGARGISICEEWMLFENFFIWAMSNGYKDNLEIDRIDNDGNYCPLNCRFVTRVDNQRNRSDNRIIEAFGEKKCAKSWSEDSRCNVKYATLLGRIYSGWSNESAITLNKKVN